MLAGANSILLRAWSHLLVIFATALQNLSAVLFSDLRYKWINYIAKQVFRFQFNKTRAIVVRPCNLIKMATFRSPYFLTFIMRKVSKLHEGWWGRLTWCIISFPDDRYNPNYSRNDLRTADVMTNVLNTEHTQLVVLNGDLISGGNMDSTNSTKVSNYLKNITRPIIHKKLPWASTYGNHDYWLNFHSDAIFNAEKEYKNSLTRCNALNISNEAGVTNYYLPVYDSSQAQKPVLNLWFFDSKGGRLDSEHMREDWVDSSVNLFPCQHSVRQPTTNIWIGCKVVQRNANQPDKELWKCPVAGILSYSYELYTGVPGTRRRPQ